MSKSNRIHQVAQQLRHYVETEDFCGYDPYDTLNGWFPFRWFGKWGPVIGIQIMKRLPVNLRPILGIAKQSNPKALGLFLEAYSKWYTIDPQPAIKEIADELFKRLVASVTPGFKGWCWGYPFDWASPLKYLPAHSPNIVATAFAVRGIEQYYLVWQQEEAKSALAKVVPFVLENLDREETNNGCFISYTPVEKDCCYNASLLAGEVLARAGALHKNQEWLGWAKKTVDFVVAAQQDDGRWNYSRDLKTDKERTQIDFHQGYVIDSIRLIAERGGWAKPSWEAAVAKGAAFYRNEQFFPEGRAWWRLPKEWPVEIHNQSQGILTLLHLGNVEEEYPQFAKTIADWTIDHFFDARKGYFYYRKLPLYTNRIPFMRWSQAWMLLALVHLLEHNHHQSS